AECLATQSTANLAELRSLCVRELQPPLQLAPQNPVFSSQILVPQQQLMVHRPSDVAAVRHHRNAVRDRPESLSAFKWNACPPSPEYPLVERSRSASQKSKLENHQRLRRSSADQVGELKWVMPNAPNLGDRI